MNELGNTPADKDYRPSGISRAEEKAIERYPYTAENIHEVTTARTFFVKGYEQAEKDLALTWEDMKTIIQILVNGDWYDFEINGKLWSKEFYEEVLKRFKEAKK